MTPSLIEPQDAVWRWCQLMFILATCWFCSRALGRGGPSRTPWSNSWLANFTGTNDTKGCHLTHSLAGLQLMRQMLLIFTRKTVEVLKKKKMWAESSQDLSDTRFWKRFFFNELDSQNDASFAWGLFLSPSEFDERSMWHCFNSCMCQFSLILFKDTELTSHKCVLSYVGEGGYKKIWRLSSSSKCLWLLHSVTILCLSRCIKE